MAAKQRSGRNEYVLVLAPPGVGLDAGAARISESLNAAHEDVDAYIKEDPETRQSLQKIKAPFVSKDLNMYVVTHYLPRSRLASLWKDAAQRALQKLEDSPKSLKLLSVHLTYFSDKRNELYSVVDVAALSPSQNGKSKLHPSHVILLIDDIFDMYARLSQAGWLFSSARIEDFIDRLEKEMNIQINLLSRDDLSRVTMGWEIRTILHLMSWRALETVMAESLARQIGVPDNRFMIWPIKQSIEPLGKWLAGEANQTAYLSHPISEPRRAEIDKGKWPTDLPQHCNRLQGIFASHGVMLALPTGIDELRLQLKGIDYTGKLEDRWPLIRPQKATLYVPPVRKHLEAAPPPHYYHLLEPKWWKQSEGRLVPLPSKSRVNARTWMSPLLHALAREIEYQIASRDFLFVYHTEGIIVFRPYYAKPARNRFSGGVEAELRLWENIVALDLPKSAAFIHFESDLKGLVESRKGKVLEQDLTDSLRRILLAEFGDFSSEEVLQLIRNQGKPKHIENILNRSALPEPVRIEVHRRYATLWAEARVDIMKQWLVGPISYDDFDELIGIWVVKDFQALRAEAGMVAKFLKTGEPKGNKWIEAIDGLLPPDILRR